MKPIAFVFPGQGSQSIGMGREFLEIFPVAREVMEEVNDSLNYNLSKIIFEGPEDQLTLTENTQPALLATSMAMVRSIEHLVKEPINHIGKWAAGHSLGEYTALCAAGAFSLRDAAKLVRKRGQAMQEAVPVGVGAMAAILGLEIQQIEKGLQKRTLTDKYCVIANDNSPGQIVISGDREAVEEANTVLTDMGAKRCVMLPVSAPFHSHLMAPAAAVMQDALHHTAIQTPKMDIMMNITAMPLVRSTFIQPLLVDQITGRVRWRETILNLSQLGCEVIIEIGAGKVLTGLNKRICPDIQTHTINTPQDLDNILKIIL